MESKLEEIVSAPSIVLEKGIDEAKKFGKHAEDITRMKKARGFWTSLGPGLVTGAADDDPSGIATYSQTGAQYNYQFLWLSIFTFPFMSLVQEMCARIGLTTGRGLAGNIRLYYPKWVLYSCAGLLFVANSFNIGADLGAMAEAIQLIHPQSHFVSLLVAVTFLCMFLQIFTPYERYAKYLKFLALVLFSYVATMIVVGVDLQQIFHNLLIPTMEFSQEQIFLVTAILGTTISPYLFFWQTSHEVEDEILHGKTTIRLREETSDEEIKKMRVDVWSGMFLSNFVMFSIIATCAAVLFKNGIHTIDTAAQAAEALRPFAGEYAFYLFAAGIVGTGLLAIPVLAGSAAYTVAESFKWRSGLYRPLRSARAFYGVIMFSMFLGLAFNFVGIPPFKMLLYSAVLNGLVAPVILFLILRLTNNKKVVRERINHPVVNVLGWLITGIMAVSGMFTLYFLFV